MTEHLFHVHYAGTSAAKWETNDTVFPEDDIAASQDRHAATTAAMASADTWVTGMFHHFNCPCRVVPR